MTVIQQWVSARGCALVLAAAVFALADGVAAQGARLCLSGSNTIGEKLAPALVKAWASKQGWTLQSQQRSAIDEVRLAFATPRGAMVVDVLAHGTSTGFAALREGECDLWMASRAVRAQEIAEARQLGRLYEQGAEHVIALDGLALIVHRSNPLSALTVDQVRDIFSGRLRDWAALGGAPGAIALHARDDQSGTYDTFRSLVMGDTALSTAAVRYESTEKLAAAVASDPRAIGFVGLAGVGGAKTLALSERETAPLAPTPLSVATEDYLLSRRLFFYSAVQPQAEARSLLEFAVGPEGQAVVTEIGFVPQDVRALPQTVPPAYAEYRDLVAGARRLTLNFRFGNGTAILDNKAIEDIDRVARFMQQPGQAGHELLLIGFADRSERVPYLAQALSDDRVDLVASDLRARGLRVARQRGLGQIAPVASNDTPQGRLRNRRVEVWIRPIAAAAVTRERAPATPGLR